MKRKIIFIMTQISFKIAMYQSERFYKWNNIFHYWRTEYFKEVGVIDD